MPRIWQRRFFLPSIFSSLSLPVFLPSLRPFAVPRSTPLPPRRAAASCMCAIAHASGIVTFKAPAECHLDGSCRSSMRAYTREVAMPSRPEDVSSLPVTERGESTGRSAERNTWLRFSTPGSRRAREPRKNGDGRADVPRPSDKRQRGGVGRIRP